MIGVTGRLEAKFAYDAAGRRVMKTVGGATSRFEYDGLDTARETRNGRIVDVLRSLVLDELLADGEGQFYLRDVLGNIIAVTDQSGSMTASYTYAPYGQTQVSGVADNSYRYTGRESDSDTLYYHRARYYDPTLGRFLQEDPIGLGSGDTNLYRYAGNNPINFTDPLGLDWLDDTSNFAAGVGDSLSFGFTDWVRERMGINDVVNKCSPFYKGGEYTEVAAEIALTLGSAAMKQAAKEAVRSEVRREFRNATRQIARNGKELHHINPLFGHPGGGSTLFPTGGLPVGIHSNRANLQLLTHEQHFAAHLRLQRAEQVAKTVVNPLTTSGRVVANAIRGRKCE